MNRFESERFPKELTWKIANNLPPRDLIHLCMSSKRINRILCQNEDFWKMRFIQDFPEFWNPDMQPQDSWKKFYEHFALEDLVDTLRETDIEGLSYYLSSGLDPNSYIGLSPILFWAMSEGEAGKVEMVRLLIETGADPNLESKRIRGYTALHEIVEYFSEIETEEEDALLIIQLLSEAGANMDAKTEYGWSPLMIAYHQADSELVKTLINAGASPLTEEEIDFVAKHMYL